MPFECSEVEEGDTIITHSYNDCCWRGGDEFEVEKGENGIETWFFIRAKCGITYEIGNLDLRDSELVKRSGPW